MTRPLDVFILGTPYCGSTLLGNALNAHPAITFVGEVNRLPFYKQFEGERFREGQYVSDCAICGTREPYDCALWTHELLTRLERGGAVGLFELLREACRTPVLVDGSKNARWLRYLFAAGKQRERTRVLHCVRSPFSFASSHKAHTGAPAWAGGNFWRDSAFDNIRTCSDFGGIPLLTVRYERFALAPQESLQTICDFLEIEYRPIMLRYWEVPAHPLGGNLGAYVRYPGFTATRAPDDWQEGIRNYSDKPFGGWHDERWLSRLSRVELTQVLYAPGLGDVASLLGYDTISETKRYFEYHRAMENVATNGQSESASV